MGRKFAQTIYESHENWGETLYADKRLMDETIESLRELGEGWEDCEISECKQYDLIRVLENGQALYEAPWHTDGYNRNGRNGAAIFKHAKESRCYTFVESFDNVPDAEASLAA